MEQDVCLFSRQKMTLTGIEEVESFSDSQITLSSSLGMIAVEGRELKIASFSTESGELTINGEFDSFYYFAKKSDKEKSGIMSRLFK